MHAVLSEEQEMLRTTAERLAQRYAVRNPADLATIDRAQSWQAVADAGLLGLRARDGAQPFVSGVEVMLVAEALAGALTPPSFIGTILAEELLALAGVDAEIDAIAAGSARYALLLTRDLTQLADAESFNGAVGFDADAAGYALGLSRGRGGARLCRYAIAGVFSELQTPDFTRVCVGPATDKKRPEAELLGSAVTAEALDRWLALALTLTCADIVGVLRSGLRQVVEYSKTRIQYGVPVGSFQAVQHMCAEMLVKVEAASSMTRYAAWTVDALPPSESLLAARTAKAHCAGAARSVAETVMQAFGGIGQTWEHIAPLMNRRVMFDRKLFGDESHQLLCIADARLVAA